jgi:hypothetical protein
MPLTIADEPSSLPLSQWLAKHVLRDLLPSKNDAVRFDGGYLPRPVHFTDHLKEAFYETYENDGVNVVHQEIIPATGILEAPSNNNDLIPTKMGWKFLNGFALFLGLPSRMKKVLFTNTTNPDFPVEEEEYYTLPLSQLGKNLIGGWDNETGGSSQQVSKEKKLWQYIALLPIKVIIILPLKLLTLAPKFLINTLKLFTEFLPLAASFFMAQGVQRALKELQSLSSPNSVISVAEQTRRETYFGDPVDDDFSDNLLDDQIDTPPLQPAKPWNPLKGVWLIGGIIILGILYTAFRLIALVGRTFTSPEKSTRMAFAYGRELELNPFSKASKTSNDDIPPPPKTLIKQGISTILSLLVGIIGAAISIAITATLWAIALPLALGAIATYAPSIYQAIVTIAPVIGQIVPWVTHLPVVTSSLATINSALAIVAPPLTSLFAPVITPLSALIGVKVSTGLVVIGTALSILAAPAIAILTRIADALSNLWAAWRENGPFTYLFTGNAKPNTHSTDYLNQEAMKRYISKHPRYSNETSAAPKPHNDTGTPGLDSQKIVEKKQGAVMESESSSDNAVRLAEALQELNSSGSSSSEEKKPPTLHATTKKNSTQGFDY